MHSNARTRNFSHIIEQWGGSQLQVVERWFGVVRGLAKSKENSSGQSEPSLGL